MTFFQKKWQCVTMWNMNFRCFLQWMNVCHLICLLIIVWCSVQPRWRQYKTQNPGLPGNPPHGQCPQKQSIILGRYPFPRPGFRLLDDYGETFLSGALPFPDGRPLPRQFWWNPLNHLPSPKAWPQAGPLLTPPSFKSLHSFLFLSTPFFLVVKIIFPATSLI